MPGTSFNITSVFGSRILKIYFLDLLFISLLRNLFNTHTGEGLFGWCLTENFGLKVPKFFVLVYLFLL